jgi:hypothetical protein
LKGPNDTRTVHIVAAAQVLHCGPLLDCSRSTKADQQLRIVKSTERNYLYRMEYLKLIRKKALGPVWSVIVFITVITPTVTDAIWPENAPVQRIAWTILAIVIFVALVRLLLVAPYQLWAEEWAKRKALEKPDVDPLKAKGKWLREASSGLLTSSKKTFNEWSVSDKRTRNFLFDDYNTKRSRMTGLADDFLHDEDIYQASQDAMNRCDGVIDDATNGLPDHEALQEAQAFTKILLVLLTQNNDKKP